MNKQWSKFFLVCGSFVFSIIALFLVLVFAKSSVNKVQEKHLFDSQYKNSNIDFVIPSPSNEQIADLEKIDETGIYQAVPFYYAESEVYVNETKSIPSTIFLFASPKKMNCTLYNEERIIKGTSTVKGGDAIVDYTYYKNNNCDIGDSVKFTIGGNTISFEITAISETNIAHQDGTIALVLDESVNSTIINSGVKYSGAYIDSNDCSKTKTYLETQYKPYGRLKDASQFSSDAAYQQHLENFNSADWSKEITDYNQNYSTLSIEYEEYDVIATRNLIVICILFAMLVIAFQLVVLYLPHIRQSTNKFILKTGKVSKYRILLSLGSGYNSLVASVVYVVALCLFTNVERGIFSSQYISWGLYPIMACFVATVIASIITLFAIGKKVK